MSRLCHHPTWQGLFPKSCWELHSLQNRAVWRAAGTKHILKRPIHFTLFDSVCETWSGERSAELVSTSETRNPKPETRNRLLKLVSNCETRNPKPETRNRLWRLNFPRTDRNPKPETRNPKPTLKTYLPQDRSKPETRNPKPTLKT